MRLVGDDQQLAAVEAGGVLRHLEHQVGAVRMHEVLRFADPAEAEATLQVRRGDPTAADHYLTGGRVLAGTDTTMPDAAYTAWLADIRAGRDALLLASSTATVDDLNARARADLVRDGRVAVDGVPLHNGTAAAVGDRVATRRNERRYAVNNGKDWVKNGDGWTVTAVHDDGSLTVQHRRHHGHTTLPADYVAPHVELDYARTVRRAQGLTVDHAHLVVNPQMSREEFYVGVSRARHGTQLYVPLMTDSSPDHRPEMAGSAREVLTQIITRSGVEPSAHRGDQDRGRPASATCAGWRASTNTPSTSAPATATASLPKPRIPASPSTARGPPSPADSTSPKAPASPQQGSSPRLTGSATTPTPPPKPASSPTDSTCSSTAPDQGSRSRTYRHGWLPRHRRVRAQAAPTRAGRDTSTPATPRCPIASPPSPTKPNGRPLRGYARSVTERPGPKPSARPSPTAPSTTTPATTPSVSSLSAAADNMTPGRQYTELSKPATSRQSPLRHTVRRAPSDSSQN